jgi:2-polyprenyl-6-methoxyphenol hydroxylase-like FAD-dependent oxidoreductase
MAEVLRSQLGKFPRFQELMKSHASSEVHVTSFKCRVFTTSAGPNWLLTGEAASMVDPMTSNGVTAALRHGAEAARLIMEARGRDQLSGLNRKTYGARILQMAKFFNQGIERVIYEPVIRNRIGLGTAGAAYTSPAWSMNVVYARLKPWGLISTFILGSMLAFFRLWASAYYRYCLQQEPLVRPKECRLRG